MPTKFISLFLLLLSFLGFSQTYTVEGIVKDQAYIPIAYANIILEDAENEDLLLGTTTDEQGFFKFNDVKPKVYNLTISFLGFEKFSTKINLLGNVNLKTVILEEQKETLDAVVVTAKRPTVKRLVDRLVFNVENSTLSNSNVLDVLKHTPGVIVRDGSISVKNTPPVVYINDRRVHLSADEVQQLLEGTPANNIKSIEVITNPPAKYDAEGGAVLNIKTSKNIIAGYHGSVFGSYNQGFQFPKYALGTSHFFKSQKLTAYINYNISPRKDFRNNFEDINFIENNNTVSSWETDYNRDRESANQNITGTINYDFNDKNSLNFSANTLIAPRANSKTSVNSLTEVFGASKVLDSSFRTLNNLVSEKFNLAFSLGYIHKFEREDEQISIDLHHTSYDFSEFQNVDTDYFLPEVSSPFRENRFQTFSSQNIQLTTGQIDYVLPSDNGSVFEAGIKAVSINSDNVLDQFLFNNGNREEDINNSDIFIYDEKNYAGYVSYEKDWEQWSLKAGLRVERTETKGESLLSNSINTNNYTNLFPSFYVLNRLKNDDEIYLSYNKRIYRPRYRELNPFKYYLNDNAYITGDPGLLPEIDDSFILGYTINSTYTFELYYRYEKNPTLELPIQDNENRLLKNVFTNIDHNESYGLDFTTYTGITKSWNLYVLSSLFYYENNFFAVGTNNELVSNERWSVYANVINYFSFLEDNSLTADIGVDYISSLFLGPSEISGRLGVDINVNKTFWNNRASLNIGVRDLFNTRNFTQTTKYLNQDWFVDSNMENRLLVVGFNYKFGNYRLNVKKDDIELIERDRLEKE
ncbi:outer membrane beta-barrel protein [Jejuia pallidilutea]|uniref:Putative TonB-dependent receptor n=1 Tax=Jejuia pallidilutea TaxID=504487 RepID=A0A090WTQ4_9FLAO|nr:outer membrane beta-barrel protein [Jejuia pallidilutea]GAL70792.1 putative TonB-dependent receptor [Jejuia pallidilutea]GAL90650.1 putative TonB-dependent receptor [Jejuia pallidilutea]